MKEKKGNKMGKRYKITMQYDGTPFVGFQVQPNGKTIQGELQRALSIMTKGQKVFVHGSGRTDAGVHALGQVAHLDYPGEIRPEALMKALNSMTDDAIQIYQVEEVEKYFHARFHVLKKRYIYRVSLAPFISPFERNYVLHHPYRTNINRIQQALPVLLGEHNFKSFCSTKTDKTEFDRILYRAEATLSEDGKSLTFTFEGNGFLYNMVRILVGTLLQIGDGLRPVENMVYLLEAQDRQQAGPTAPACGLYLEHVSYMDLAQRIQKSEAAGFIE